MKLIAWKRICSKTVWPMPMSQHVCETKGRARKARNKEGIE